MRYLHQRMEDDAPRLNPILAEGVAVSQLKYAVEYLDSVFKSASMSFPEGLEYRGCSVVLPHEEYNLITTKGRNKETFDVAQSDLYLVKFFLRFNGEDLPPRYTYLLYPSQGGYVSINGVNHLIMPTLNDIVFSVTSDSIFVRLLRDRMRFQRVSHSILRLAKDGRHYPMEISVVYSPIHKKGSRRVFVRAQTTNMHYLLAKYGFSEAFQRFAGFVPDTGLEEINYDNYPEDKYVIYGTSTTRAPRAIRSPGVQRDYQPTRIRVAVPKEHDTPLVRAMLGGFYYVADLFPTRVNVKYLDSIRVWRVLLGLMIYPSGSNEGSLYENITEHIKSLDHYLDVIVKNQLKEIGYEMNDIYEILALLLEKFPDWLRGSNDRINSLYGKELNVNYFVLFYITSGLFTTVFKLNQLVNTRKSINKTLTDKDIIAQFDRWFSMGLIYRARDRQEVSVLTIPNDNKALRLTSMMIPQTANGNRGNQQFNINDPSSYLHVSVAEVAGYSSMSKSAPDGRRRLNHYLNIDEKYRILRNEELKPLLDHAQKIIQRK